MSLPRMTRPQRDLLAELLTVNSYGEEGLYIARHQRYWRTARALVDRGLARIDQPDYSNHGQDHYVLTDEGRAALDA